MLYDIRKRQRILEYRFEDASLGDGGVAFDGSVFVAINYGRLARLRLVTVYPGELDFSKQDAATSDDGIFKVDISTAANTCLFPTNGWRTP